jgi:hypothetical protein
MSEKRNFEQDLPILEVLPPNFDGFEKNPSAALRFNFVVAAYL